MPREIRRPRMTLHKPSGQARCRINGRDHYLGPWGSAKAQHEYDHLLRQWTLKHGDMAGYRLAVDDLAILYDDHVAENYRGLDGRPTSEVGAIRLMLKHLVTVHGRTLVCEFGPRALKQVRERMIEAGYVRSSINVHIGRLKRLFRWAVENELCPPTVHQALCAVSGIRAGRSRARESEPVRPVAEGTISDTLPFLPPVVQSMVRLQLLTGARPTEVCTIRPCDVTMGKDGVWCYRPEHHKTEHHGKERRIYVGPEGQDVLRPFLDRGPEAFCFQPAESEAWRNAERRASRRSPMTPSQAQRKPKGRELRDRYTKDSYNRAVARACERAFGMPDELRNPERHVRATMTDAKEAVRQVELNRLRAEAAEWRRKHVWSPNQLRHSRATILRERYGVEAAQLVLGHADPGMTLVYAERDFQTAARIMSEVG